MNQPSLFSTARTGGGLGPLSGVTSGWRHRPPARLYSARVGGRWRGGHRRFPGRVGLLLNLVEGSTMADPTMNLRARGEEPDADLLREMSGFAAQLVLRWMTGRRIDRLE